MKPTHFFKSDKPCTIRNILDTLRAVRMDRAALVRKREQGKAPGICILITSPAALRDLGPFLLSFVRGLNQNNHVIAVDENTHFTPILEALEQCGTEWAWSPLDRINKGQPGALITLVTPKINESFADGLTQRGCICNLT